MSHTNSTPNYNLPQYVGSDIINPLTDTNGAYSDIDTALKQIADAVADDTTDITNLKTKVGTDPLTTDAQTLSGAVNELDAEINTASTGIASRVTSAENDIDVLESQMTTATGNITTLQQGVSALNTAVEELAARVDVKLKEVTADGVLTQGALVASLLSGVTFDDTALNNYYIEIIMADNTRGLYKCSGVTGGTVYTFTASEAITDGFQQMFLKSDGTCVRTKVLTTGNVVNDLSSIVLTSGVKMVLYETV